jgi:hypothetical protein
LVVGAGAIANFGKLQSDPTALLNLIAPFALIIVLFVIFLICVGLIVQAGTILILGSKTKYELGELVRNGLRLALPLLGLGLLSAVLTVPAFFLFIIPGIAVALFFMFSAYELVLGNRGVLGSLSRSAYLVKNNFGYVFVRALVILGLSILIWVVSAMLGRFQGASLITWIISMVFGWYVQSYAIILYKNLEETTKDKDKGTSLVFFVLVAIVGYVAAGAIVYSVAKVVTNPAFQKGFQQGYNQSVGENQDFQNLYNLDNIDYSK